jgi:type I restriction enzyme S subunit
LVPIPPLVEQHRIVVKVDELMALCDQLEQQQTDSNAAHQTLVETLLTTLTDTADQGELEAAWHRIANHFDTLFTTEHSIDQLKQTILQLAVMGKLVSQDPNDEPASVLLEKIAKEKVRLIKEGKIKPQTSLPEIAEDEKAFELPQGWAWTRLNDAIDVRDGTHDTPKEAFGPNTYPLVTSQHFQNGLIKFNEAKRISEADHLEISKRSKVERFDILFSMIGGNLGNQVMVNDDRPFSVKNVALFKYYNREFTLPYFIKKFMEHLALDLQASAIGGAQPFVSLGFLRNLVIALPPVIEQQRIITKVDQLMAICDTLKARLNDARTTQIQLADAIVERAVA